MFSNSAFFHTFLSLLIFFLTSLFFLSSLRFYTHSISPLIDFLVSLLFSPNFFSLISSFLPVTSFSPLFLSLLTSFPTHFIYHHFLFSALYLLAFLPVFLHFLSHHSFFSFLNFFSPLFYFPFLISFLFSFQPFFHNVSSRIFFSLPPPPIGDTEYIPYLRFPFLPFIAASLPLPLPQLPPTLSIFYLICEAEERGLCHLRNDVGDLVQREVNILEVLPRTDGCLVGSESNPGRGSQLEIIYCTSCSSFPQSNG